MIFSTLYGGYWYWYVLDTVSYLILIPAIILSVAAELSVKSTFSKYKKVASRSGMTGAEAARKILAAAGVNGVSVMPVSGELTDNYNPKTQVLSLSQGVFNGTSVAAIGVAAHEAGHAIQHGRGYIPLKLRSVLVPVTRIGSILALPLALLGVIIEWITELGGAGGIIIAIGILCYSLSTIFSLITLPVELNASKRARQMLLSTGALDREEVGKAGKVLNAAAFTYVASLAVSFTYLLRFIFILNSIRRKD